MNAFLGGQFDQYIRGYTAIRRVHGNWQDGQPGAATTYRPDPRPGSEYLGNTSVIELDSERFFSSPGQKQPAYRARHDTIHELFHTYANSHPTPAIFQTEFATAAGWTNIETAWHDFRLHRKFGSDLEGLANQIINASAQEDRGFSSWGYGIAPNDPVFASLPPDKRPYQITNISEDFATSSTEFAVLWLAENHIAFGEVEQVESNLILSRPAALHWLEKTYGRTLLHTTQ